MLVVKVIMAGITVGIVVSPANAVPAVVPRTSGMGTVAHCHSAVPVVLLVNICVPTVPVHAAIPTRGVAVVVPVTASPPFVTAVTSVTVPVPEPTDAQVRAPLVNVRLWEAVHAVPPLMVMPITPSDAAIGGYPVKANAMEGIRVRLKAANSVRPAPRAT